MRNIENKYPNKLQQFRKNKNLTLKQAALLLHMQSENRLCRWERGQSLPSSLNLIKLALLYKVEITDIYEKL